jgi:hypothetical protein
MLSEFQVADDIVLDVEQHDGRLVLAHAVDHGQRAAAIIGDGDGALGGAVTHRL